MPADRNYFRLAVNVPVELEIETVTGPPMPAAIVNISEGGCRINAKAMMLKDAKISFDLNRPGKAPLRLSGIVKNIDFRADTRLFDYGVQFVGLRPADADAVYQFVIEEQRRALAAKDETPAHGRHLKDGRAARQEVLRVERAFEISYSVPGQRGANPAIALDISRGGMRIVLDRAINTDRSVDLRFTLPQDVLDALTRREESRGGSIFGREISVKEVKAPPFPELRVAVKFMPGMHEIKGRFHYSVSFLRPKPEFIDQVERYIHAAHLTELKKKKQEALKAAR